jgi:hypothetical protein
MTTILKLVSRVFAAIFTASNTLGCDTLQTPSHTTNNAAVFTSTLEIANPPTQKKFIRAEGYTEKYKDPNYFKIDWNNSIYGVYSLPEFRNSIISRGWIPIKLKQDPGFPSLCSLSYAFYEKDLVIIFCVTDSDYNKYFLARLNGADLSENWRYTLPHWVKSGSINDSVAIVLTESSELQIDLDNGVAIQSIQVTSAITK